MSFDKLFHTPPTTYRLVPFWFWNGDMNTEEIISQIREMAEKGIGGFFICARQGLTLPYLSAEWFQYVALAVETAQHYGLDVWLYDEYPYPSGMSGGEVTLQHPEARQHQLIHRTITVTGPQTLTYELPWARVLSAQAIPLDGSTDRPCWTDAQDITLSIGSIPTQSVFQATGLTRYTNKRFFTADLCKQLLWHVPPGRWMITIFLEKEIDEFKYFGNYVDPCHKEAVQTFLHTTHERYAQLFSEHFGRTIKGIFTDEVGLLGNPPWSSQLPAFFQECYGEKLAHNLHALFYPLGERSAQIRYRFFQSIHLLLREIYHKQVGNWCDRHHLLSITEVPSARITTQRYSHILGGDSAHEKIGLPLGQILDQYAYSLRGNPKIVSSLAHQQGSLRSSIECFHSVGWSMTLQDAKWMLDRLAAFGINFFVFHAFFYSISGLRKHDAPPSQFQQNPYWPHFRQLADYAGRLCYALSQGRADVSVAVVHPTTTFWTHMGNPLQDFRYCGSDVAEEQRLKRLKQDWANLCKHLLLHQVDYDHLDPELVAEEATVEEGQLLIGQARYSVLILPPMTNLEQAAWAKIKTFLRAGGKVISVGLLPYERIEDDQQQSESEMLEWFGLTTSPYRHYWQELAEPQLINSEERQIFPWVKGDFAAYFIPRSEAIEQQNESLLALLQQCAPPTTTLEAVQGEDCTSFLMHQRRLSDGSQLIFITHQEGTEKVVRLSLRTGFEAPVVERLEMTTGKIVPLAIESVSPDQSVLLSFAPYESYLLRCSYSRKSQARETGLQSQLPWLFAIDVQQQWALSAQQANILRFGNFGIALDLDGVGEQRGWYEGHDTHAWPLVETRPFINQCADIAMEQNFPMQFSQSFGLPVRNSLVYPIHCWYHAAFHVAAMPSLCQLMMDEDAISGSYSIYVNGQQLTAQDFVSTAESGYQQLSCHVQHLLKQGDNQIVVAVEVQKAEDGLRDPLYLSGPFGIFLEPTGVPIIGKAPESGKPHGGIQRGYPYYAGILCYSRTVFLEAVPHEKTFALALQGWDDTLPDCVELLVNGHALGVCCWSPYHWEGKSEVLQEGTNTIEIRVTNTLNGILEGTYFDERTLQVLPLAEYRQWM